MPLQLLILTNSWKVFMFSRFSPFAWKSVLILTPCYCLFLKKNSVFSFKNIIIHENVERKVIYNIKHIQTTTFYQNFLCCMFKTKFSSAIYNLYAILPIWISWSFLCLSKYIKKYSIVETIYLVSIKILIQK
jgi:hypothetical protein